MIRPLTEAKDSGVRLIQYGPAGAGKSVRAADAVRWGRVEYHDFDDLSSNLRVYLEKANPTWLPNISFASYTEMTPEESISFLFARIEQLAKAAEAGKPLVETLVLDSFSRFEDLYLTHLMGLYRSSSTGWGAPRATISPAEGTDVIIPGSADHDLKNRAFFKFFQSLKSMRINVIVNCHEQNREGDITIRASGAIRSSMPTDFNEWHYLFVDQYSKHRVQVKPAMSRMARTALTAVPPNGILLENSLALLSERAVKNPEFAIVAGPVQKTKP